MPTTKVSPGARLLRSSRMFSLPTPIPAAQAANSIHATPQTATTPYPISQAITAPYSSRMKGDWGLKRPLPLKTTLNTTTPMIRVKAIDAVEKLTDFSSASDLGLTVEKFHQLGIALSVTTKPTSIVGKKDRKSVFDEDFDFTAIHDTKHHNVSHQRWKFKGPWLSSMTPGEFSKYLVKVSTRQEEFRYFLRQKLAQKITDEQNRKAVEEGHTESVNPTTPKNITDAQMYEFTHRLRDDSSRYILFSYIGEFLDLPPVSRPLDKTKIDETPIPQSPYAYEGPPKCHPSAGLSYLRTSQFLENHPLYGPQKQRPATARIVTPWKGFDAPKFGLAGFIVDAPMGHSVYNARYLTRAETGSDSAGILNFNPNIEGGAKISVVPTAAKVDSRGRIIISVDECLPESRLVYQELQGTKKIYLSQEKPVEAPMPIITKRPKTPTQYQQSTTVGSASNYGFDQ